MPRNPCQAFIHGIGVAAPAPTIGQAQAASFAGQLCGYTEQESAWVHRLYERTRVRQRGCAALNGHDSGEVGQGLFQVAQNPDDLGPGTGERLRWYAQSAQRLAFESASEALERADVRGADITHLVTASCTGFEAPGVDVRLIDSLALDRGVARTHIGFMGCHAALNALRVASAFVRADPRARVLVCAVEVCSVHFHYGRRPDRMLANALFADGSASAVLSSKPRQGSWAIRASGSHILPDSAGAMTWRIGDHGFEMSLSPELPRLIRDNLGEWIDGWLKGCGLDRTGVASWAIHPGGPKILEAAAQALELSPGALDASRAILESHGNMSSPTVLFILDRLRAEGAHGPCVALGFGPGLAIEGVLLDEPHR
ncbi:MAG: type III polyketide synthase [Planctomycetes bacterium]|nr:type III polyketide synthase [Planctomycetota bacterium]